MSGMAKNGVLYPSGIYAIDDNAVSPNTGWSSQKVMDKLASVKSIMRVDAKPTLTDGTITYIKDGTSYTTTDQETWFYYVVNDELYKTIFIDGVEYTKADSGVSFDDFIEKSAIVTTLLNDTVTNEQVVSAKIVHELTKGKNLKTYTDYPDVGIDKTNFTLEEVATKLNNASALMVGTDNKTPNIFPKVFGHFIALKKSDDKVKFFFFPNENGEDSSIYFCGYHPRIGVTEWQKVCTTRVPDVPKTNIVLGEDCADAYQKISEEIDNTWFLVKNGWCMVQIDIKCIKEGQGNKCLATSLPKPMSAISNEIGGTGVVVIEGEMPLQVTVSDTGEVYMSGGRISPRYIGTFSYPVAEDWRP